MYYQMPFGKHKGEPVEDIPTDYLRWLFHNVDLNGWLLEAVYAEIQRRKFQEQLHDDSPRQDYPPPVDWKTVIRTWHRDMVRKYHPDRGGSTEVMQALNDAADRLRELVEAS